MVAFDAGDPVAVSIGCKRPPYTLVHRIAVHPGELRKGHGRHLLTSLSAKLAILGPPHLVAEVGAGNAGARALFGACGWREDRTFVDYVASGVAASPAPSGLVVPVTVDDLIDIALPAPGATCSWGRSRATLLNRRDRISGLAIASGEQLEASVLYTREDDGRLAIWSLFGAQGTAGEAALGLLLRELAHRERGPFVIPRIGTDEVALPLLLALGFTVGAATLALGSDAHA